MTTGREVSLATLSAECFDKKGRPLRVAVDTPLALFEFKAATAIPGIRGMNHIVRGFYYHVLHLLSAGAHPLFVFDGPQKPLPKGSAHPESVKPCKHAKGLLSELRRRNEPLSARTKEEAECERQLSHVIPFCRTLLNYMDIPYRDAPAEAEAECAELEKRGVVDTVLTRDGDAFVFGSRRVLQKQVARNKVAMVHEFRMEDLESAEPNLRQNHLFLLAMMAGGDYDVGIQGCGSKIAVEAARRYFGSQLEALITRGDPESLRKWKERLVDGLRNNPQEKFSRKWASVANAVAANPSFPSRTVANYYLKPLVSSDLTGPPEIPQINWTMQIPIAELRNFTRQVFDWRYQMFAQKFVELLALPCLTTQLLTHGAEGTDGSALIEHITMNKDEEGFKLLRVQFIPAKVVPIDISGEPFVEGYQANRVKNFDPAKPVKEWVPRWVVAYGAPSVFQEWSETIKMTGSKRAAPADSSSPKKRGRGRPRKVKEPDTVNTGKTTEQQLPEALLPESRGRSRKELGGVIGSSLTGEQRNGVSGESQEAQREIVNLVSDSELDG